MGIWNTTGWMMVAALTSLFAGCGSPGTPPGDASVATPCTSHADCDDDLFCTGTELCMPSSPDALANGCLLSALPCAAASCDEATDACATDCEDEDGDGHDDAACGGDDCDDDDGQRFPGNNEVCDLTGHDEDCDPCTVGTLDADQDLFLSAVCANEVTEAPSPACGIAVVYDAAAGTVRGLDCNDATGMIKPGQAETCNAVDDDCDGSVDENLTLEPYWPDVDMDLAGDESATPVQACARPEGWASSAGDCDDLKPEVRPFATELCDDLDNDCDSMTDEQSASYTFYRDADGDGVGNSAMPTTSTTCDPPLGYSALPGDCDDGAPLIYPGAVELCDRIDNNCSMVMTPGGVATDEDVDDDGHAPIGATCSSVDAGTFPADDCDEANATVHGGAVEFCSAIDEDCDGETDEAGADVCGRQSTCDEGCVSGTRLSLGDRQLCVVLPDQELACWDTETPPTRVSGLVDVAEVAVGGDFACVRLTDRTVRCWGRNNWAQLGVGHSMPVTGVVTPVGLGEVVAVDTGGLHSCALKANGHVWCWGDNDNGQLGLGHTAVTLVPTRVPGLEGVVEVQVRLGGACVRTGIGDVYCWGYGGVGNGTSGLSLVPLRTSLTGALELAADATSTTACARLASGWTCWGGGSGAGTGVSQTVLSPTSLAVPAGVEQLSFGSSRGCGLMDGAVSCWGLSDSANFGETRMPAGIVPASLAVSVPLTRTPTVIACDYDECCGLAGNEVTCWGAPVGGIHGDGPRDGSSPNVPVGLSGVTSMGLGGSATLALGAGGLHSWGAGSSNGFADELTRFLPDVLAPSGVTQLAVSGSRRCTLDDVGTVRCWGAGGAGDVANTSDSTTPLVVDATNMGSATQVWVGRSSQYSLSCALDADGAAWCWGGGGMGSCGNGTFALGTCDTPVPVTGGHTFTSLSLGAEHACGITEDQALYCWGSNAEGQLGIGTQGGAAHTPQAVLGVGGVGLLTGVTRVQAMSRSTCALRSDGQVLCFGDGSSSSLGTGSEDIATTPVLVSGLTDADRLSCGGLSCFARKPNGTWVGWGRGRDLGIEGMFEVPTPAPAAFGLTLADVFVGNDRACGVDVAGMAQCWGDPGDDYWNVNAHSVVSVVSLPPPI